jgi:hypothetical protein
MKTIKHETVTTVHECDLGNGLKADVPLSHEYYSVTVEMLRERAEALWPTLQAHHLKVNTVKFMRWQPGKIILASFDMLPTDCREVIKLSLHFASNRQGWQPIKMSTDGRGKFTRYKLYSEADLRYLNPRTFRGCRIAKRPEPSKPIGGGWGEALDKSWNEAVAAEAPASKAPEIEWSYGTETTSIYDTMKRMLESFGCWPNEAVAILDRAKTDAGCLPMASRWQDRADGYESSMMTILWMAVKMVAIDYLRETKPRHFAITMLTEG